MSETEAVAKKEPKWTKEYMRDYQRKYMRERWRRVHGVKPENYQEHKSLVKQAEVFGEAAVEFCKHLQQKNKGKKPKPPPPKTVCQFCQVEHNDTEGMRRKHEKTVRHRLAVELYEAHAKALAEQSL